MSDFVRVCRVSDVPDPGKEMLEIEEQFVVLFHIGGEFFALDDCCTHDGGPLGEGTLDGFTIACPRHGAEFDVRTGQVLSMPATRSTTVHEVKVEGEDVFVKLNED